MSVRAGDGIGGSPVDRKLGQHAGISPEVGQRVRLIGKAGSVPPGTLGTVTRKQRFGTVHVAFDGCEGISRNVALYNLRLIWTRRKTESEA